MSPKPTKTCKNRAKLGRNLFDIGYSTVGRTIKPFINTTIMMSSTTRCSQGRVISRIFRNTADLVISCNKTAFRKAEIAITYSQWTRRAFYDRIFLR